MTANKQPAHAHNVSMANRATKKNLISNIVPLMLALDNEYTLSDGIKTGRSATNTSKIKIIPPNTK